jgi:hypothetical protein
MRLEIAYPTMRDGAIYDTCHSAMSVAKKLDVIVIVQMNGVDMQFYPDDSDIEGKVDTFKNAVANGHTVAC